MAEEIARLAGRLSDWQCSVLLFRFVVRKSRKLKTVNSCFRNSKKGALRVRPHPPKAQTCENAVI